MTAGEIVALIGGITGFIASLCAVVAFVIARKKDGYEDGRDNGGIHGDIKYMRNGFDDLRLDVKEIGRKQDQHYERLIRVEESCKSAHNRIDSIERKIESKRDE